MLDHQKDITDEIPDNIEMKEQPQTGQNFFVELCGEFIVQLVLLGICFLIGNIYFAYVAFGVGALFLILPFGMLVYFIAKKYLKK